MEAKRDPELFRAMSVPHESTEAGNAALTAFLEGVGELRKTHRIANVVTTLTVCCLGEDGQEGDLIVSHQFGDTSRNEALCAYAFGRARKEREEQMVKALRGEM